MSWVLSVVIATGVGIGFLWVSTWVEGSGQAVLQQVGGAIVVAALFTAFWELRGKRALTAEAREEMRVAVDLEMTGLRAVTTNFRDGINWREHFNGTRNLDIFFAYGSSWRGRVEDYLKEIAQAHDAQINVYLPNPQNDDLVAQLAARFNKTADDVRRKIEETASDFWQLRRPGGAEISVFYRDAHPLFSCYRFDSTIVVAMYTHQTEKQSVPIFVCRSGGTLFEFFSAELEAIADQCKPAVET
jgi:hypothetical protein